MVEDTSCPLQLFLCCKGGASGMDCADDRTGHPAKDMTNHSPGQISVEEVPNKRGLVMKWSHDGGHITQLQSD